MRESIETVAALLSAWLTARLYCILKFALSVMGCTDAKKKVCLPPGSCADREPRIRGHRQDRNGGEVPSELIRLRVQITG
jgi:hypothetical protein